MATKKTTRKKRVTKKKVQDNPFFTKVIKGAKRIFSPSY